MNANTKKALLIGGAAAVALLPSLRNKLWQWMTFNTRTGQVTAAYAVGNFGADIGVNAVTPANATSTVPVTSVPAPFFSDLAKTIAPIATWVDSVAAQMVSSINNSPATNDAAALPGQTVAIAPYVDNASADSRNIDPYQTPPVIVWNESLS